MLQACSFSLIYNMFSFWGTHSACDVTTIFIDLVMKFILSIFRGVGVREVLKYMLFNFC